MSNINTIAKAVARQARNKTRRMNLEKLHEELRLWLAVIPLPKSAPEQSWDQFVKLFPPTAADDEAEKGIRLRFTLKFYTESNQYLISIMESLDIKDAGNHILSTHVNWQGTELRKHTALDEGYGQPSDGSLKAKHTLWAQSFRPGELAEALNAAAVAILGHELKDHPPQEKLGELVQSQPQAPTSFPKIEDA